jgi:hypothetical protein
MPKEVAGKQSPALRWLVVAALVGGVLGAAFVYVIGNP